MHNKKVLKIKENLPSKEKMHPKWRSHGREIEITKRYFNYLHRYIRQELGSKWNDVYSDLKETFIKNGHLEMFTDKYLSRFIDLSPLFENGKVYHSTLNRHYSYNAELSNGDFYVDKDGIVQEYKKESVKQMKITDEEEKRKLLLEYNGFISNGHWFKKSNGIWYMAEIVKQKLKPVTVTRYDEVKKEYVNITVLKPVYSHAYGKLGEYVAKRYRSIGGGLYVEEFPSGRNPTSVEGANVAINKKICSTAILKKYNLQNDQIEEPAKGPRFRVTSAWNGKSYVEHVY